jgi:hypothetical protein
MARLPASLVMKRFDTESLASKPGHRLLGDRFGQSIPAVSLQISLRALRSSHRQQSRRRYAANGFALSPANAVDGDGHAMTIADYSAICVLIVLATWAGVTLYLRGSYNGFTHCRWLLCRDRAYRTVVPSSATTTTGASTDKTSHHTSMRPPIVGRTEL